MKGLKKRTIFLMAIVAAGIVTAGCIAIYRYHKINGYGKSFYSDGDSKIEKEIKLFIGSRNLAEKLGYYSMYPYYYQKVKSMEIEGETEIKAIKLSEKDIIEKNALYKEAVSKGYKVSDSELKTLTEKKIEELKKLRKYDKIKACYEAENTTLEREFKRNRRYNRIYFTLEKWYNSKNEGMNEARMSIPQEFRSNLSQQRNTLEEKIISRFKSTRDYVKLKRALKYCRASFKKYGSNAYGARHYAKRMNVYKELSYRD